MSDTDTSRAEPPLLPRNLLELHRPWLPTHSSRLSCMKAGEARIFARIQEPFGEPGPLRDRRRR